MKENVYIWDIREQKILKFLILVWATAIECILKSEENAYKIE
jgi:hypothetical protein